MIVQELLTELGLKDGHKLNLDNGSVEHVEEILSFANHEAKVKTSSGHLFTIQKDGTILDSNDKKIGKTLPISV